MLLLGRKIWVFHQKRLWRRVEYALQTVGMLSYAKRAPHMLSGGQKQRVAIAGVLAIMPDIIVFDEPTAMLDPIGRDEVMHTIRQLNREKGKTILMITHNMEEAVTADRVVVLKDGLIFMQGTPRDVFSHVEELREAGLKPPFATMLQDRLKDHGVALGDCAITIEEMVDKLCQFI